ncbi:MAG: M23 family metallopeptidase [Betaproteobacteria bacterium]|nr:M23 family metallopeptidase [Betaproteobacteria bacterium]
MNIIISSDNLRRTFTIALAGWRAPVTAIVLIAAAAFGIYKAALQLAEGWVAEGDARIVELVRAEQLRADAERRELIDAAVGRLDSTATDLEVRMWRLARLGNIIAEQIGLPTEQLIDPDLVPLPIEPKDPVAGEIGLSEIDARLHGYELGLGRLDLLMQSFVDSSANLAMLKGTLPILDPPPVTGTFYLSSTFGRRSDPFTGRPAFHSGYDYAARTGTPVVAAADGYVTYTGRLGNYGKTVEVYHGDRLSTLYAHLHEIRTTTDAFVRRREVIGYVGSTGRSTGPHLHFELRIGGRPHSRSSFAKQYRDRIALLEQNAPAQ